MPDNVLHYKQDLIQQADDPDADFPAVPVALLEALERRFPDQRPEPTDSDREIWMAVGRTHVVRFLREMHERPRV